MDLLNLFAEYGAWSWIVGGLVLLAIELIAPGGVFVWLGGAAVLTGLFTLVNSALPLPFQFAIFGALSLLALMGWIAVRRRALSKTDSPFLNRRAERHMGKEGFLSEPIVGETGRMELGDSVWRVRGPELPVGHRVKIVGSDGALLEVVSAEKDRVETV
ncbi:MAG: NfeD family protein [Devosiaceae bacterium]|nr:NfeD family protein [Devosiaceae bacterium]